MRPFRVIMLSLALCIQGSLYAQQYKIRVQNTSDEKIVFSNFVGELSIVGYEGKEVIIENISEEFKKEYVLSEHKDDNTGLGFSASKDGRKISLSGLLLPKQDDYGRYQVRLPGNVSIVIRSDCGLERIMIKNMKQEIEADVCDQIEVIDVTGPLALSTITGNMRVSSSSLHRGSPISLVSVSGNILLELPQSSSLHLQVQNISGKTSSDFKMPGGSHKKNPDGSQAINAHLNGGATPVYIMNASGDVEIRARKVF